MAKKLEYIKTVAAAALASIESVLDHFLPGGKCEGAEYKALNPTRADAKPGSFSINTTTGRWCDFATDDKGGDAVSLVAYLEGCSQSAAAKKLASFLGVVPNGGDSGDIGDAPKNRSKNKVVRKTSRSVSGGDTPGTLGTKGPILPIPAQVSPLPAHSTHGEPIETWPYRNTDSDIMFYVARFEPKGKRKQILPLTWWPDGWRWKALDTPRPLYNLDLIASESAAVILVAEGEKAANAAAILFPDAVATTSSHGSSAANKADWSPLKGRVVRIWPDHDAPGKKYAAAVARLAYAAGAKSVELLELDSLTIEPGTDEVRKLPSHWDAADALGDGWKANTIKAAARWQTIDRQPLEGTLVTGKADKHQRPYFDATDHGVFYYGLTKDGNDAPALKICSELYVRAYTRSTISEDWGRLLEFTDRDDQLHRWAMPMALMRGSQEELRGELYRLGVEITTHRDGRRLLGEYLQNESPEARARCVTCTGWHGGAYVFPERTIGGNGEQYVFQAETLAGFNYAEAGTLETWRSAVASSCQGNSRLVFAVSLAFAAMLLDAAGDESGGVHIRGGSSTGKTTALYVAGSVYGGNNFVERWRATDNGLEALAEQHNHALLILDELAQIDPKVAGEAAYMLANGAGKTRADRNGGARASKRWQLLFLSAGEIGLSEHMATGGKRAKAGQEIRMADIPADAGVGLGIFETLHGHEDGAAFSRAIRDTTQANYGVAAPAFIEAAIKHRETLPDLLKALRASFVSEALAEAGPNPSGQAHRVAGRFGLIAAAGELATAWGITGWPQHEAERAARACYQAWLDARGGATDLEELNLVRQVRGFFEEHGEARFTLMSRAEQGDDHAPRTSSRVGFVHRDHTSDSLIFYVLPVKFREEVCNGFDHKRAAEILVRRGYMMPGNDETKRGPGIRKEFLPGYGRTRCYVFNTSKWSDD